MVDELQHAFELAQQQPEDAALSCRTDHPRTVQRGSSRHPRPRRRNSPRRRQKLPPETCASMKPIGVNAMQAQAALVPYRLVSPGR